MSRDNCQRENPSVLVITSEDLGIQQFVLGDCFEAFCIVTITKIAICESQPIWTKRLIRFPVFFKELDHLQVITLVLPDDKITNSLFC